MITDAHAWRELPDRGQHVLRCLHQELTESRDHRRDELAVILAGHKALLHEFAPGQPAAGRPLSGHNRHPRLYRRPAVGHFAELVAEAGSTLTPDATRKAAAVLSQAEDGRGCGNARLAVRLLTEATAGQAHRITTNARRLQDPAALGTICVQDIPEHLHTNDPTASESQPGLYL
jgi:hypothetical protein